MSSPVVFCLTKAQAVVVDGLTRPGWKPGRKYRELESLRRRYLIRAEGCGWTLTAPGRVVQELVRVLRLHADGADG